MRLTQFTDYSLRLVLFLAQHPHRTCTVREVAAWYGVSRDHLVKVSHKLAKLGFIASQPGRGGGLRLAKSAADISLADVITATEPDFQVVECLGTGGNSCRITQDCQMKHVLSDATRAFFRALENRSFASLALSPFFTTP